MLLHNVVIYWKDIQNNILKENDIKLTGIKHLIFQVMSTKKILKNKITLIYYYQKYNGINYTSKLLNKKYFRIILKNI